MFDDLRNRFDFFLRNNLRFSRKNFIEKNKDLIERNIQENLYTQDLLERFFDKKYNQDLKILDIGSKNWFYAKGEYNFFNSFAQDFTLNGVEFDAYRLYTNFYNRFEVAKYYTKELKNTNYIADNLLNICDKYDYIIWFLPFVLKEPHKMWGLPEKYFYPQKLLAHAYNLLKKGGQMLIINQGEIEANTQKFLFEKLNIEYKFLGEIKSKHFEYNNKRYGYLVKKTI